MIIYSVKVFLKVRLPMMKIYAETYLEYSRVSTMELFGEYKIFFRLKYVNYFRENAPSQMFDWVLNRSLSTVKSVGAKMISM